MSAIERVFATYALMCKKPVIREGILGMAEGGTRKIVLSPMGININGVRYEEELTICECSFQRSPPSAADD